MDPTPPVAPETRTVSPGPEVEGRERAECGDAGQADDGRLLRADAARHTCERVGRHGHELRECAGARPERHAGDDDVDPVAGPG